MLVYRVENEDGDGPYITMKDALREMRYAHGTDRDGHPTPYEDGITFSRAERQRHVCGFDSLAKARDWFYGYAVDLDRAGFDLTLWEAQDVERGNKQVMFRKDTAKMLESYSIIDYIE